MVTEIAIIDVKPGSEGRFAADFQDGGYNARPHWAPPAWRDPHL
jgi:hypothetical protein